MNAIHAIICAVLVLFAVSVSSASLPPQQKHKTVTVKVVADYCPNTFEMDGVTYPLQGVMGIIRGPWYSAKKGANVKKLYKFCMYTANKDQGTVLVVNPRQNAVFFTPPVDPDTSMQDLMAVIPDPTREQ